LLTWGKRCSFRGLLQGRGFVLDLMATDEDGRALIHAVAEAGDVEYGRVLVRHKERFAARRFDLSAISKHGLTPMHYAAVQVTIPRLLFTRKSCMLSVQPVGCWLYRPTWSL
jgi:hypothetical protein